MKTLSSLDLELVTGGKTNPVIDSGSSGSNSGGNNDALLTTLQGIQSSLKDLGKNQNQGLFGGNNALLFMTMAMAFSRRSETVIYSGRRGYYWQSSW